MIVKLKPNRVYRTYPGGSRIDALVSGQKTADGPFPEDWLASTVRAFNPGREDIIEGLGMTEDGIPVTELAPEGLPILVKLLDAADRLVIQVHPTRAFAWEAWQSKVGKTESWYILEADETACVYIGFQEHVTREAWIDVCERQDVEGMLSMLHRFNVKKGDCIFVPGGVPHAIGGGCLLWETQEPSDLIVVPERFTPAGIKLDERKLHGGIGFERMYDCFVYEGRSEADTRAWLFHQPAALGEGFSLWLDAKENGIFSVVTCEPASVAEHRFAEPFAVAVVTDGSGTVALGESRAELRRGDRLLITELDRHVLSLSASTTDFKLVLSLPKAI